MLNNFQTLLSVFNCMRRSYTSDDPTPPVFVTVCFGANDAVNENSSMAALQAEPHISFLFSTSA